MSDITNAQFWLSILTIWLLVLTMIVLTNKFNIVEHENMIMYLLGGSP